MADDNVKSIKERLIEKYDKKGQLTPEKKAVLEAWVDDANKLEGKVGAYAKEQKEKALVLKLYKQIEERERKKAKKP
jgi:hypothetical protein